ncbi:C-phycoerythrin beta chain [Trichinella spiralis]|uniref:C-phycoerythrin beta chain n=1 Tax=Trichinella spiralis TaxID=6334 RepID=A0ABR3KNC9_TRISP
MEFRNGRQEMIQPEANVSQVVCAKSHVFGKVIHIQIHTASADGFRSEKIRDSKENKPRPLANRNYNLEENVITVNLYERYSLCSEITDERLCNVASTWMLDESLIRGIDIEKILGPTKFQEMPSRSRDPGNVRMMQNPELEDKKNECYWFCVEMGFSCKREEIKLALESVQRQMGTQLSEKISEFLPELIVGTSKSSTIPKLPQKNYSYIQQI